MQQYDYVCHYGTKGMRWGERLYQNPDGSLTALGRLRYGKGARQRLAETNARPVEQTSGVKYQNRNDTSSSEKPNYSSKARAKNIDEMDDNELRAYNERIRLEQAYKQLTAEPVVQKKISKGEAFAKYSWEKIVLPTATNLVKGTLEYAGKVAINKMTKTTVFNLSNNDNKNNKNNDNKNNDNKNNNSQDQNAATEVIETFANAANAAKKKKKK